MCSCDSSRVNVCMIVPLCMCSCDCSPVHVFLWQFPIIRLFPCMCSCASSPVHVFTTVPMWICPCDCSPLNVFTCLYPCVYVYSWDCYPLNVFTWLALCMFLWLLPSEHVHITVPQQKSVNVFYQLFPCEWCANMYLPIVHAQHHEKPACLSLFWAYLYRNLPWVHKYAYSSHHTEY